MIVICKKGTTRLIKGNRYEVEGLYNDGANRYNNGTIFIKNFGRFKVNNFTDTDGGPVPEINIPLTRSTIPHLKFEDLKVGDIIVCRTNSLKTIVENCKYKIESLCGGVGRNKYIKLEGIKRKIIFDSYKFRKLTLSESREHSLNLVFSNESDIVNSDIRKIDLLTNKDEVLIKMLCKSAIDPARHDLGVRDWSIHQSSKRIDLVKEDFEHLMELSLRDILEILK